MEELWRKGWESMAPIGPERGAQTKLAMVAFSAALGS